MRFWVNQNSNWTTPHFLKSFMRVYTAKASLIDTFHMSLVNGLASHMKMSHPDGSRNGRGIDAMTFHLHFPRVLPP